MSPTKWKAGESVKMVTDGFDDYRVSASLVRDGDTKDYGDLLNAQKITWGTYGNYTDDFTFPDNVPVGDYTLTFTDHEDTARMVRVHLDHGAGYLLSGDTPAPKPTPKPTPTPAPAPTSGEHTVEPAPGAATTTAPPVVPDGNSQGVVHVGGGMSTLPHTGV